MSDVDLASLAIKVDATEADKATSSLNKLEASAKSLEDQVTKSKSLFASYAKAIDDHFSKIDKTLSTYGKSASDYETTVTKSYLEELNKRERANADFVAKQLKLFDVLSSKQADLIKATATLYESTLKLNNASNGGQIASLDAQIAKQKELIGLINKANSTLSESKPQNTAYYSFTQSKWVNPAADALAAEKKALEEAEFEQKASHNRRFIELTAFYDEQTKLEQIQAEKLKGLLNLEEVNAKESYNRRLQDLTYVFDEQSKIEQIHIEKQKGLLNLEEVNTKASYNKRLQDITSAFDEQSKIEQIHIEKQKGQIALQEVDIKAAYNRRLQDLTFVFEQQSKIEQQNLEKEKGILNLEEVAIKESYNRRLNMYTQLFSEVKTIAEKMSESQNFKFSSSISADMIRGMSAAGRLAEEKQKQVNLEETLKKEKEAFAKAEFEQKASYNRRAVELSEAFNRMDAIELARLEKEKGILNLEEVAIKESYNRRLQMYSELFSNMKSITEKMSESQNFKFSSTISADIIRGMSAAGRIAADKQKQISNELQKSAADDAKKLHEINSRAFSAETEFAVADLNKRVQLEQATVVRGEETKASIRIKYAQQEEAIKQRLSNSLTQIDATLQQGIISRLEALTARTQVLDRAEQELIRSNEALAQSLNAASDSATIFHRVLGKTLDMLIRMAAYRLITIVAGLPGELFEVNKDMELLRIRLEGVLKSAEAMRLEFKRLEELDIKTPFDLQGLSQADLMMRNFGLAMNDVQFKAITDQVSQLGGETSTLIGILRQLGQAWGKDKLQLVDLKPMIEQGLPAIDLLTKAYHTNAQEILQLAHDGKLGRQAILELFDEMERNAPNAAAKNMDTLSGAMSNVKSSWEQLLDAFMGTSLEKMTARFLTGISSINFALRDLFKGDWLKLNSDILGFLKSVDSFFKGGHLTGFGKYLDELQQFVDNKIKTIQKTESEAQAKADAERTKNQSEQLSAIANFDKQHLAGTKSTLTTIGELEKATHELKIQNIENEIAAIEQIKSARLSALDVDKEILNWEISNNKVSFDDMYSRRLALIEQVKQAEISAIDARIAKEQEVASINKEIILNYDALHKVIADIESSGGTNKKANLSGGGAAVGPGQTLVSTLIDPGVKGVQPFRPAVEEHWDQLVKNQDAMDKAAIKYWDMLDNWRKQYLEGLIKEKGIVAALKQYGDGTPEWFDKVISKYKLLSGQQLLEAKNNEKIAELNNQKREAEDKSTRAINSLNIENQKTVDEYSKSILSQTLNVEKLTTAETDLAKIRKNAYSEKELSLSQNKNYQQAVSNKDQFAIDKFEAEAEIKAARTVADAEIALVNKTKDAKLKAFSEEKKQLDFNLANQSIAQTQYTITAIDLVHKERDVQLNALDFAQERYKSFGGFYENYQAARQTIIADAKAKEQELNNSSIVNSKQYQEELEKEKLALYALSHSVDEVVKKQKELFLATNKNYLAAKLKDKATGSNDAITYEQTQDLAGIKKINDAQLEHEQRLIAIKDRYNELSSASADYFDGVLGGVNTLSGVFNNLITSLDKLDKAVMQNAKDQKALIENKTLTDKQWSEQMSANAQESEKLEKKRVSESLSGSARIADSVANMFEKNSSGMQAFHDLSMTLGAIELAFSLSATAEKMAANASEIASNLSTIPSKLASAAATFFAQSGWGGFAGVAAMAAVMGSLGYAMSGGFNSYEKPPESSPDKGTVLGNKETQSQSVDNVVKTLEDIHASEYKELRGINSGIIDLQAALTGSITTLFQAGGLDTSNRGINLRTDFMDTVGKQFTSFTGILSTLTLGLGAILFSGGYKSVTERGIKIDPQAIGELINGAMLDAVQYNVVKIRSWDLFSDSTKYETVFNSLDNKVTKSLTAVYQNVGNVSLGLAEALGGDLANKVKAYKLPELKIDLTDLNAEDASKKLNAVISTALDDMAETVFGKVVGQYQQLGEGMLETAARLVAETTVVKDALSKSSLTMPKDALAISNALVTAAGGLKEFQQQFSTYYDKFYSDSEKQAILQKSLTEQLMSVFVGLPATREGYRKLIEALDLNNAKDRERYSLLIKLADSADSYYSSLEKGIQTYKDNITSAFDKASSLLNDQISTYQNFLDSFKDLSKQLSQAGKSPQATYQQTRSEFYALQNILANGTDAEKLDARNKLVSVTQAFIDSSKGFYASGLGYSKDVMAAQSLLDQQIDYSKGQVDMAQNQLDRLTDQVTALGLINDSVLSVKDAVDAVNKAITDFNKAQDLQAKVAAENANKAAYQNIENDRRAAYDAPIDTRASKIGKLAGNTESMKGWSANTSKKQFSAEAFIDATTGNITGGESYSSSSGHSSDVINSLKTGGFANVRKQFSSISRLLENIIGGELPDIRLKISSSGDGKNPLTTYSIGSFSRSLPVENVDPLIKLFAKDATSILADGLNNEQWSKQIKQIGFSSIGEGFNQLSMLMQHLQHPYVKSEYDPNKDYLKVDGSHRSGLDSVPYDGYVAELHKNERVLTAQEAAQYGARLPFYEKLTLYYFDAIATSLRRVEQLLGSSQPQSKQTNISNVDITPLLNGISSLRSGIASVAYPIEISNRLVIKSLEKIEKTIIDQFQKQMYVTINLPELQAKQATANAAYDSKKTLALSAINSETGSYGTDQLNVIDLGYFGTRAHAKSEQRYSGSGSIKQTAAMSSKTALNYDENSGQGAELEAMSKNFKAIRENYLIALSQYGQLQNNGLTLKIPEISFSVEDGPFGHAAGYQIGKEFASAQQELDANGNYNYNKDLTRLFIMDLIDATASQLPKELADVLQKIDATTFDPSKFNQIINDAIYQYINPQPNILDGSHRSGLDNVPFDGYIAELHKGERVLTANQSSEYSKSSNSDTLIIELRQQIQELKAELRRQTQELRTNNDIQREAFIQMINGLNDQLGELIKSNKIKQRIVRES